MRIGTLLATTLVRSSKRLSSTETCASPTAEIMVWPVSLVAVDAHGRIGLAGLLDKRVELLFVAAILGLDGNAVLRVGGT